MSRNIVPRENKDADLGTQTKNWNKLYTDAVILRGNNLQALLDGKTNLNTLMAKGDIYVATGPGAITRLPKGADGNFLTANSLKPEGLEWKEYDTRQPLTGNITVTVGSGGDFGSINQAIANITSSYFQTYKINSNTPRVTIRLLPGFVMAEQIPINSIDLSWITIIGDDDETIIDRQAITRYYYPDGCPVFIADNGGFIPIIGQLFNMNTTGDARARHGIAVRANSGAVILPGCGIKNVTTNTIQANNSVVIANGAILSGPSYRGIYADNGSIVNAAGADISGAGDSRRAIYANGSIVNAAGVNASGACYTNVVAVNGSIVNVSGTGTDISGGIGGCINAQASSIVNAAGSQATSSGGYSIYVASGAIVNIVGATTGSKNIAVNTLLPNGIIFS